MLYLLEAVDNFFFRSGVPFDAGGNANIAEGNFPPLPSVYAGALRPFAEEDAVLHHKYRISYNGIQLDGMFYFPLPKDLYLLGQKEKEKLKFGTMEMKKNSLSSYPLPYQPYIQTLEKKKKSMECPYLSLAEMVHYLNQDVKEFRGIDLVKDYLVTESKLGIEMEWESGTSKNQMIYETSCVRAAYGHKLNLVIEAEGIKENVQGVLKLGGEGKRASVISVDDSVECPITVEDARYFKLYLATPAIFSQGWLPYWVDEKTGEGYFSFKKKKVSFRLISACTGRVVPCGGFGYHKEERAYLPREMTYAVPAGSVYYFELLEGRFEDVVKLFHKKCISDYREGQGFYYKVYDRSRYCDRGFGYTLVGKVTKKQEELFDGQ